MRARDARAISFCGVTTAAVLVGSFVLLHNPFVSLAATAACAAGLLTRPRMIRVIRRLRGEADWSGYFDNEGTRFTRSSDPGKPTPRARPAERP